MGLLEQLQEQGWHLLPAGIERLLEGTPGSNLDAKQAIKLALDIDLREIGGGALGSISARGTKADSFDGNIVVQVLKVRNISAPKANEESKAAPRLLKLTITDGQTQYSALEGEHVPSLSLDTAPGTKIYLKNGPIKILQGMLILNANNVSILGGKVPALFDKWELTRAMAKYAKGGRMQLSASGPPPWIPFGQKIQQNVPSSDTKNFKSLQTKEKDESKENAEFTALRNDAIAEANKLGTKKTFGGGAKQMVDANVQKIMDKGFSEEQANHALKLTRNNVQRALGNLQRIEERRQRDQPFGEDGGDFKAGKVEPPQRMGKPSFRGKRESESDSSSKPSAKVSLFDFLEDILPETDASATKKSSSKESTPFGGKDGKPGADRYDSKYNSYSGSNHNNRSSAPNPYQSNSSSSYNSGSAAASKSYNQQRFENNISSSFATRNTHPGPGNRSYGQQNPQQQNSNPSGGYNKQQQQSSYNDYNSSRGYRGGPPNSTGGGAPVITPVKDTPGEVVPSPNTINLILPTTTRTSRASNSIEAIATTTTLAATVTATQDLKATANTRQAAGNLNRRAIPAMVVMEVIRTVEGRRATTDKRTVVLAGNILDISNSSSNNNRRTREANRCRATTRLEVVLEVLGITPVDMRVMRRTIIITASSTVRVVRVTTTTTVTVLRELSPRRDPATPRKTLKSSPDLRQSQRRRRRRHRHHSNNHHKPETRLDRRKRSINLRHNMAPRQAECSHRSYPATTNNRAQVHPEVPSATTTTSTITMPRWRSLRRRPPECRSAIASRSTTTQVKPHQQQAPMVSGPPPPATTPVVPKNFIQLPNGFNYNPYQIMGFQNKQTNEFALNVLKSQQFDALQTAHLAGGPPVQAIPGVPIPGTATVVSSVLAPAGPAMPAGALPNWKIGDRCLAKYWEDGGFYNAEITAISESTFVVCFLEYGNYEEVLKTDCIPLAGGPAGPPHPSATMGFHHPQAALGVPQPHPAMMAPHPPPPPAGAYPVQQQGVPDSQSAAQQQHYNPGYKPQPSQYAPHPHQHGHPPPPHHHQQQRPSKFREQRPIRHIWQVDPLVQAIPGVPIPGTATVVSSVLAPAGPAMPAGALPNWKIGDRCLAKYWEDGGFYNAEITAISESTFVVCFLEYGNYEEALKTDCIPLAGGPAGPPHPSATMGFHHPQAALGVPQPHPAMMAPHPPPPPAGAYPVQQQGVPDSQSAVQQQHYNPGYKPQPSQYAPHPHQHGHPPPPHHHQQQRPSKFREQRPMYVPPAQRK
ncbi:hypothetical protein pipiens_012127 [Culex pipiens pipiens]|uniref:Survival of motor neuron-related-splicing factor 30 n=1 Tax=Culex pipiens pipiens TaxID=38569 RepID=A0ABD1D3J2_CULPP